MIDTFTKNNGERWQKESQRFLFGVLVGSIPASAQNFQSRGDSQFFPNNLVAV